MSPTKPIKDLQLDERVVDAVYLLEEKDVRTTRNGSPYLSAVLSDSSGRIPGRFWSLPANLANTLVVGQGVRVSGTVTDYKGQLQIKIEAIQPHLIDTREFLPAASRSQAEMEAELAQYIRSVADPWLRQLLERVFLQDPAFLARFAEAPAAKEYHHACLGGLIEHTLDVAGLVAVVVPRYPRLSRDLLLALALLHDVGKVETYDWQAGLRRSDEGELLEHLYLGTRRVERAIEAIPGFPPELRRRVLHGLLAHHGQESYGSPVRPKTLEAVALHQLDMLDSRIRGFLDHLEQQGESEGAWTGWSKMFEARLYRGEDWPEDALAGDDALGWEEFTPGDDEFADDDLPF